MPVWERKIFTICLFLLVVAGVHYLYSMLSNEATQSATSAVCKPLGIVSSKKTKFLLLNAKEKITSSQQKQKTIISKPKKPSQNIVEHVSQKPNTTLPKSEPNRILIRIKLGGLL